TDGGDATVNIAGMRVAGLVAPQQTFDEIRLGTLNLTDYFPPQNGVPPHFVVEFQLHRSIYRITEKADCRIELCSVSGDVSYYPGSWVLVFPPEGYCSNFWYCGLAVYECQITDATLVPRFNAQVAA